MNVKKVVRNAMKSMKQSKGDKGKTEYFFQEGMYLLSQLPMDSKRVAGENLLRSAIMYIQVIED